MLDLKPGDTITRTMHGFRDELWHNSGEVLSVSDTEIVCIVYVDVPRTMTFNRKDGVDVLGREYGWLETGERRETGV